MIVDTGERRAGSASKWGTRGASGVPSVEGSRGIATHSRLDEAFSSRVLVDKGLDIVHESRNDNQLAGLGQLLDCVEMRA